MNQPEIFTTPLTAPLTRRDFLSGIGVTYFQIFVAAQELI